MRPWKPLVPFFSQIHFGQIVLRPSGQVASNSSSSDKSDLQYCRRIDKEGRTTFRCSPLAHEAMNEPQTNYTDYPELPEGAIEV